MHFICPLCRSGLVENSSGVACASGHHFDRAKEGYLNLLPVQHKNSLTPGDAKAQLVARRQFLNAGFFSGLLPALQALVPASTQRLLDIGCGEGYFTHALANRLPKEASVYGIDIARDGVRMAAKAYGESYAVASAYALPLATASMEVITRIYAPSDASELKRVLQPGGRVIVVTPADEHLLGLRQQIYQVVRPHPEPGLLEGFVVREQQRASFALNIPAGEFTASLLKMTPFAWKMDEQVQQQIIATGIQDAADFHLTVYLAESDV
jgi:23S rRNA (guanine745-N1)-methyltransferase